MRVVSEGVDLGGCTFCDQHGHPLDDVRVGIQVGQEPDHSSQATRGRQAGNSMFESSPELTRRSTSRPAVHGKLGNRFST